LRTQRFYDHTKQSPNLVILELTDESLNKVGRFPWTRTRYAKILDNLKAYGARVVMFDVLYPEPESKAADGAFLAAIERFASTPDHAAILGYGLTLNESDALKPLPDPLLASVLNGKPPETTEYRPYFLDRLNFAAPVLQSWDARFGSIVTEADRDGVFRQAFLLNNVDKNLLPSLGMAAYVAYFKQSGREVSAEALPRSQGYVLHFQEGNAERRVLAGPRGEIKLRFFGAGANFRRVPVEDVFFDENPKANEALRQTFAGKAVLFGSSAMGAHDMRHTPVEAQMPGMYMHANLFHALDQNFFFAPEDASLLYSFLLFALGVGGVLALSLLRDPLKETAGVLALLALIYAADYFYFAPQGYFIRLFAAIFAAFSLAAWFTLLNVFAEAREKKKIRDTFTRYVAPEVVREMLANPEKLKVGGVKKEISMLFSDVRDFTTISERLSAGDLATLLNIYMGKMTDILFDTGGTLDKYIGDALVGFWGAPLDDPDHAYHAVKGGLLMIEALPAVNQEFARRKFPKISVGLGINTGEVSVGNMGSDRIFQYTALGDAMNLASRLESLTKHYGVNFIISEFTLAALKAHAGEFKLRPLDLVQVKGKKNAVRIYEVIPSWSAFQNDELRANFTAAYDDLYLLGRFELAGKAFKEISLAAPEDEATRLLNLSCEKYCRQPPGPDWNGVTVHHAK
ncbi:MAG: adenylate/guanylate cyclase domain-containing protein, partial [Proteobacteria bacterium]